LPVANHLYVLLKLTLGLRRSFRSVVVRRCFMIQSLIERLFCRE
jgi:hypothetical protein